MKKFKKLFVSLFLVVFLAVTFTGCYTLVHDVGAGAKGGKTESARQWYVLWGLVPINTVDSKKLADGARDYTVKSQFTFVDYVITMFTWLVTISCQTVEVQK